MREIKFRAWHKRLKVFAPDNCSVQMQGDDPHVSFDYFDGNFDTAVWYIEDVELMQFTGLKDKNGVDIYEGDIVKFEDIEDQSNESNGAYQECFTNIGSIYYSLCCKGWDVSGREVGRDDAFYDLEVTGNIYENPDFLEVE